MDQKIGVLLINVGTPDDPTEDAVRAFLSEFLSDPLVVDYPRWLWKPILNRIILPRRPQRSALLYEKIWGESGSPLLLYMKSIAKKITHDLAGWPVTIGMRYGNPSISSGLADLRDQGVTDLVIFPLFPQYSSTTSGTAIEKTRQELIASFGFQNVTFIKDYHKHPAYISALADSIQEARSQNGKPDITLFSYHGVPKRLVTKKGEPYQNQCLATAHLTAGEIGLKNSEVAVSFQSRFGPEAWLEPNTDEMLVNLAQGGCEKIQVICPGFSADCLETLEEISIQGKILFSEAGGKEFYYIPALNDRDVHIQALAEIIRDAL